MEDNTTLKIIAHIKSDFVSKFAIPRQSGLVKSSKAKIIFSEEYRNREALRGIEGFSHLWLIWKFSKSVTENWSPTVRPPRLGGNKRMGVFATRSPFRPNPIGLSSVKIEKIIENTKYGTIIEVSGADLLDGTPIYDIKPYIAFSDSHPDAKGGFSQDVFKEKLEVCFCENLNVSIPNEKLICLTEILAQDPRPAYQTDNDRVYSFEFSDYNVKFKVNQNKLYVTEIQKVK